MDEDRTAGRHDVTIDGRGWSSGVYLVRLAADNEVETGRMLLVK